MNFHLPELSSISMLVCKVFVVLYSWYAKLPLEGIQQNQLLAQCLVNGYDWFQVDI